MRRKIGKFTQARRLHRTCFRKQLRRNGSRRNAREEGAFFRHQLADRDTQAFRRRGAGDSFAQPYTRDRQNNRRSARGSGHHSEGRRRGGGDVRRGTARSVARGRELREIARLFSRSAAHRRQPYQRAHGGELHIRAGARTALYMLTGERRAHLYSRSKRYRRYDRARRNTGRRRGRSLRQSGARSGAPLPRRSGNRKKGEGR